jgi:hypothetical protein
MNGAISSQGARNLTWRRLVGIAAAAEVVVLLGIAGPRLPTPRPELRSFTAHGASLTARFEPCEPATVGR